jgi:hypothetical protein
MSGLSLDSVREGAALSPALALQFPLHSLQHPATIELLSNYSRLG